MVLIFFDITIRFVQELKGRCSAFTMEALKAEYEYPSIYQELKIAVGSSGSQRKQLTLRGQSQCSGPNAWYDFVEVVVTEDRRVGTTVQATKAHYVAQIICFVDLSKKRTLSSQTIFNQSCGAGVPGDGDEEPISDIEESDNGELTWMLAFVKFHVNSLSAGERGNDPTYGYGDLTNVHKVLPFSLVQEDSNPRAKYGLIDTEQIQQGVWVQNDFQTPDRLWVIKQTALNIIRYFMKYF